MFTFSLTPPEENDTHFIRICVRFSSNGNIHDCESEDWMKAHHGGYLYFQKDYECLECGEYVDGDWVEGNPQHMRNDDDPRMRVFFLIPQRRREEELQTI